ncbi:MAG: gamma-glutamyl-gamma-aminobutyrate hydrolase family protein [Devosiaceae bacterium]|nr:gamma-glutamyl-gamma-aminobutyrate hydrolase family protein [Devosiaceae bacterium]
MKITILQVGQTPEMMQNRFERYPKQYQGLLLANGEDFSFDIKYIIEGEELPSHLGLEGVIITGSAHSVYDDIAWIEPLRDFVKQAYALKTPMVGICFGHQIMADALGGTVEKSHKGWGIGRHVYRLEQRPDFINGAGDEIAVACSHQDQVVTVPDNAKVFLSSDFTPNAGLVYNNGAAISLQPHPEFDKDYAVALVDRLRGNSLSEEQANLAERSLDAPLDRIEVGDFIARFFKQARQI